MLEILAAAAMGGAVAMLIIGISLMRSAPNALSERLDRYGGRETPLTLEEVELDASFYERVILPGIHQVSRLAERFAPRRSLESNELRLARAGNPNGWTAADFWGLRGLAALLGGGIPFVLLLAAGIGTGRLLMIAGGFTGLGFYFPVLWLNNKTKARKDEIQKALPDALDLMTVSVEAGLGFDAAMQKVAEKWDNELCRAYERASQEMRIGRSRREALRDMATRIDVDDLTSFVAAVLQADQLGVSMGKVLRIQSEQMRIRRRQRAEEAAQKAPIKMLFPMVFLIFPSLFIVLLGPAVLILMEQFA